MTEKKMENDLENRICRASELIIWNNERLQLRDIPVHDARTESIMRDYHTSCTGLTVERQHYFCKLEVSSVTRLTFYPRPREAVHYADLHSFIDA